MLQFLFSLADESDYAKIEYLYKQYHRDMLRMAKSRLHRMGMPNYELDAEDAVQNAFVKITKYIRKVDFHANERVIRGYIMTIVSNEVTNIVSDYTYFEDIGEYAETLEDGDFFEEMRTYAEHEDLIQAIGQMDEKYSIPLLYRYGQYMNVKEIADLMGIAEKTVYTRIERARKMLIEMRKEKEGKQK